MGSVEILPFPKDLPFAPLQRISLAKLAANDVKESERLLEACLDYGFFLLDLTGSDEGIKLLDGVETSFGIGKEFFAEDLDTKKEYKLSSGIIGYKPMGAITLKDGKSDLMELCAVGKDSINNPNIATIPKVFDRERIFLQQVIKRTHDISTLILKHLAGHLDISYPTFEKLHDSQRPSSSILRFIHYPPQNGSSSEKQASLQGHTDSGTLTILFTNIGGLQVMPPNANEDDSEAWQWVRPEPGCAVINVGDTLVQWTGGILRSNFHRVLYAPGEQGSLHRYSFGYFLKPADDASMDRIQEGEVVPKLSESEKREKMPVYNLWHREKSKKVMQGHQDGVSRGGTAKFVRKESSSTNVCRA